MFYGLGALLVVLAGFTPASAEQSSANPCALASARPMLNAQLLFGLRQRHGRLISEASWRLFLDRHITPRFPAGLTVFNGKGQWRQPDGRLLREPSRIVLIVASDEPATVARLAAIRAEYMNAFAQDSAGLVISRSCAVF